MRLIITEKTDFSAKVFSLFPKTYILLQQREVKIVVNGCLFVSILPNAKYERQFV